MSGITIKEWDEADLFQATSEWRRLLESSSADKLFLSWEWVATWWKVFGDDPAFTLTVLSAYDEGGALVGVAPLYIHDAVGRGGIRVRRLQFIGNCWRNHRNIRSEYMDFIAASGREREIIAVFLAYIRDYLESDEFIICNLREDSPTYALVAEVWQGRASTARYLEHGDSFGIFLKSDLKTYLASLSARTRGKAFNQRKRLEAQARITRVAADQHNLNEYFRILNSFHEKRWGKSVFDGKRLEFHEAVARALIPLGGLDFVIMYADDRPISALYDFRAGGVKYGYQMGFDENFDRRLSPAFLQIGYGIEEAFKDGLTEYDFLRGAGKTSVFYKEHLTKPLRSLVSVQLIRSWKLRLLYGLYGGLVNIGSWVISRKDALDLPRISKDGRTRINRKSD